MHRILVAEQREDLRERARDGVLGVRLVPPERGPADPVSADHERDGRGNGDDQPAAPAPPDPRARGRVRCQVTHDVTRLRRERRGRVR